MKRQAIRKTILFLMFLLFPAMFSYLSPYIIIQAGSEGLIAGSFFVFVAQFLLSLVLGRAFCGWVCPAGALQDCARLAVDKRAKGGWRNGIKYAIWAPWLAGIVMAFVSAGGIKGIDFFYYTDSGFSVAALNMLIIYLLVTLLLAALALIWGRRAACHYICWMAPFMVLGTKLRDALRLPGLRLEVVQQKCTGCKQCAKRCPMSLEVESMVKKGSMKNDECILCGECVDGCQAGAVRFRFGRAARASGTRRQARYISGD